MRRITQTEAQKQLALGIPVFFREHITGDEWRFEKILEVSPDRKNPRCGTKVKNERGEEYYILAGAGLFISSDGAILTNQNYDNRNTANDI